MNKKQFEDDGVEHINNYNYTLLDTYYEYDGKRIIEWNKHSSNAEYDDLERITEILNIKQMRLESLMKHREEIGKLLNQIDEQQFTIEHLQKENEELKHDSLAEENKHLKDLLNEYYDKIISLETEIDFLQMENNEIKYVLKNIRQIELKK